MISKVDIRNFSTHKKQDIEFGPNVTTITGSSFHGKSTILRAIKFVCLNQPTGDKFINWDAEKTSVRLTIDNKKRIVRRKGKGINEYILDWRGAKDNSKFKAFGNDVPKPIADLVNMSDINFQGQHDAPFWFCETAGEVSRQLNKIINLEVIDKTLANISSGIRKAKTTIEITQERLDNAIKDKKNLDYTTELDEDLVEIEKLEGIQNKIVSESTRLRDIIKSGRIYKARRDNAAQANLSGLTALDKGSIWLKIRDSAEDLDNRVKTAIRANKAIQAAPPNIESLDRLKRQWSILKTQREDLENIIDEIKDKKEKLCRRTKETATLQNDLSKVSKGVCPLCQRPMIK